MVKCHYCSRFQKESTLEHIPNKKSYYCKLCGYSWSEDSINDMLPKAGGFPLTVVKEDLDKEAKSIYKTSVVDDEKEMLKATKNNEDQTYTADDKKKRFKKK